MKKPFAVNVGYDRLGRPKNRRFETQEQASEFANEYFRETGIVLSVVDSRILKKHPLVRL